MNNQVEHLFICLLTIGDLFCKVLFQIVGPVFFLVVCLSLKDLKEFKKQMIHVSLLWLFVLQISSFTLWLVLSFSECLLMIKFLHFNGVRFSNCFFRDCS